MWSDAAARWRAAAVAALTAALSVGAHAVAHGGAPSGAGLVLVVLVAATVGIWPASGRGGARTLAGVLTAGQVLNHLVLAASGHSHAAVGPPSPAMVAAHATAVLVGAVLIAGGGRLCAALSRAVRALTTSAPQQQRYGGVHTTSDQPLQSMLVLAASISHRGPPVGVCP